MTGADIADIVTSGIWAVAIVVIVWLICWYAYRTGRT